jgi:flavin-dependent dehydrogenase
MKIERPDNWEGRPYARETGWTDDHRAFRDWLMNELVLAGCEIRTSARWGWRR